MADRRGSSRLLRRLRPAPPPQPPAPPVARPPDFVGIGVQKAGTTWWYRLLEDHPEVVVRKGRKEVHFFDRFGAVPFNDNVRSAYYARFARREGKICGEWTPRYMADFWVAPLLHRTAPDAKLLVLLRDPVTRYSSGVRHSINEGVRQQVALRDEYARGRYAEQLARYLQHFDRSQILVQVYEECAADPMTHIARTFAFLGIDPGYQVTNADTRYNLTGELQYDAPPHVVDQLVEMYRPEVDALAAMFPELDLSRWTHFA